MPIRIFAGTKLPVMVANKRGVLPFSSLTSVVLNLFAVDPN
jgi:hypothetical protein